MVRELVRSDLPQLLELYEQFGHDDDPPVDAARLARAWDGICASDAVLHLGAFEGERLVATAHAGLTPNLTRGARPYAVIENVVTRKEHRRRGHGARVMRALVEACWERGCYKIMLLSGAHRPEAHRFYEALGFDGGSKRAFQLRQP